MASARRMPCGTRCSQSRPECSGLLCQVAGLRRKEVACQDSLQRLLICLPLTRSVHRVRLIDALGMPSSRVLACKQSRTNAELRERRLCITLAETRGDCGRSPEGHMCTRSQHRSTSAFYTHHCSLRSPSILYTSPFPDALANTSVPLFAP